MAVMRGGRVFEKVGVNVSTVHGRLGEAAQRSLTARREIPGLAEDPRFWAAGISLVAHMRSPRTPAVHMNTRMFWTPGAWWFGGGSDLNPAIEDAADTAAFHAALKGACDAHDPGYYPRFKAWADDYFMIRHRGEARGVGGSSTTICAPGDWEADFAFTRDVGRAFSPPSCRSPSGTWASPGPRRSGRSQLVKRGRYAEFNLRLRPRHPLRAGDGAQRRGGADVAAAGGEVAVMRRVRPGEGRPGRALGTRQAAPSVVGFAGELDRGDLGQRQAARLVRGQAGVGGELRPGARPPSGWSR